MIAALEYPWLLAAVPLLVALVVLLVLATARRRHRRLERLGADAVVSRLVPGQAMRAPWRRALLLGLAAACAGAAFTGPRWGVEHVVQRGTGVDVVLALDASLSMLATDERPNRLERMRDEARRLLAASPQDRFGLIAFAGRSYILTPLTVDQGALELFLDNLDPSVVGRAGSTLSAAIRQGTDLLSATRSGADRALVLMSDGEAFEPEEDIVAAAKRAGDAGIMLVTVGFGTQGGSTIPVMGPQGTAFKRDASGQVVVTHYTPVTLRDAAAAAHGVFIPAEASDKAARVRNALATLRSEARATAAESDRMPRFQWFLVPALLLLLADTLLAERHANGRRRRLTPAAARPAAVFLLALLVLPRVLHAEGGESEGDRLYRAGRYADAAAAYERAVTNGDDSPRTLYNLGTALLASGSRDQAEAILERAVASAQDADIRFRALFNLGLSHLQRGLAAKGSAADQELSAAVESYKRALRLRPDSFDAKWNYELANRRKKRSSGGGGGGGGGAPKPQQPKPSSAASTAPTPSAGLDPRVAEQILNSAEREERDVQARQQRENQPTPPPGGKDW